jgi:hypothetical protein
MWVANDYPLQFRYGIQDLYSGTNVLISDWSFVPYLDAFLLPTYNSSLVIRGFVRDAIGTVAETPNIPLKLSGPKNRPINRISAYFEGFGDRGGLYNPTDVPELLNVSLVAAAKFSPEAMMQVLQDAIFSGLSKPAPTTPVKNCSLECGPHGICPPPDGILNVAEMFPSSTNKTGNATNKTRNATANNSSYTMVNKKIVITNWTYCVCEPSWDTGPRCSRHKLEVKTQTALSFRMITEFSSLVRGSLPQREPLDIATNVDTLSRYLQMIYRIVEDLRRVELRTLAAAAAEARYLLAHTPVIARSKAKEVAMGLLLFLFDSLPKEYRPTDPTVSMPAPLYVLEYFGKVSKCMPLKDSTTTICYDIGSTTVSVTCPTLEGIAPFVIPIEDPKRKLKDEPYVHPLLTTTPPPTTCTIDLALGLAIPYPCPCAIPHEVWLGYGRGAEAPLNQTMYARDDHMLVWQQWHGSCGTSLCSRQRRKWKNLRRNR